MRLVSLTRLLPAFVVVGVALPATAAAQSTGGASVPPPQPASDVALVAAPQAYLGHEAQLSGSVARSARGRVLRVQRFDEAAGRWRSEARTVVGRKGRFAVSWSPTVLGTQRIRATLRRRRSATVTSASPEVSVRVYRSGIATWYGPGFYGNKTACGIELTETLVGVAHRTLPCGTMVTVHYGSKTILAPVVDRGPFGGKAKWDLTKGAADLLGFTATDRIGTITAAPAAQPASK